ncbi:MaoC/PaaZ C-terminal domain-containing protein [Nocardioides sp. LHG3406-4]|uniref:MaoC/PaaZ C-terminal domain-containing protein n=1 Tax=Nocardioides sp. LHG3406-4 TaxID=2804575 RepID=UPI003CF39EAC
MTIDAGTQIPELRVTVDPQAMKPFALLLRDPNPIHLDPDVVAELGLGDRVINQGPLNAAYVWEAIRVWLGDDALVRRLDLRFTSNAFAGEALVAGGRVEEVHAASAELRCTVWLRREDGTDVLTGTASVVVGGE